MDGSDDDSKTLMWLTCTARTTGLLVSSQSEGEDVIEATRVLLSPPPSFHLLRMEKPIDVPLSRSRVDLWKSVYTWRLPLWLRLERTGIFTGTGQVALGL